jgi:FKBP-type peptidyl-prolyl cis-trans isomerase SlyD
MKIAKNTVVTVNYKLSDAQDNLIEDGRQPMVYLHGGYENTLPKIEEELDGKEVGYSSHPDRTGRCFRRLRSRW